MDIRSKLLVLYTMKMNNVNQLKLKYTNTKIVNLEMYASVSMAVKLIIQFRNSYQLDIF